MATPAPGARRRAARLAAACALAIALATLHGLAAEANPAASPAAAPAPLAASQTTNTTTVASSPAAAPARTPSAALPGAGQFVRVADGGFALGCSTWFPMGFNLYETLEQAAGAPQLWSASLPAGVAGPQLLRDILDAAVGAGFNVVRVPAYGVSAATATQTGANSFSEASLKALDLILAESGKRGLRVLLALTTNWPGEGGIDEMAGWAGAGGHDAFFSSAEAKRIYLQRAEAVVGRTNSVTGVPYTDDPTIFAWDLINEPRCFQCGTTIASWVDSVAPAVKAMAPKQLLTIGEEGFWAPGGGANPQGPGSWAEREGQDFVRDHASPAIDFMAIHLWPDNWKDDSEGFIRSWLRDHAAAAKAAGKPLLLEEYGAWYKQDSDRAKRVAWFKLIADEVAASASSGGALRGALAWQFADSRQVFPRSEGGGSGLYGIFESDAAFAVLKSSAKAVTSLVTPLADCTAAQAGLAVAAPPGDECARDRVRGLPGTGREGPACGADVDECLRGTHDCSPGSLCVNTDGAFFCACVWGPVGSGAGGGAASGGGGACAHGPDAATLDAAYASDGPGMAQCAGGRVLPWPAGAAGARPNPFEDEGALPPSPRAVVPARTVPRVEPYDSIARHECLEACEMTAACIAADYNPGRGRCRLRGHGGGRQTCENHEEPHVEANQNLVPQTFDEGAFETFFRLAPRGQAPAAGTGPAE